MNQTLLMQDGYEKLASERARLQSERDHAAEQLRHAREFGGATAENGEYIDAQQNLERIHLRLTALEGRLGDAEIVLLRHGEPFRHQSAFPLRDRTRREGEDDVVGV